MSRQLSHAIVHDDYALIVVFDPTDEGAADEVNAMCERGGGKLLPVRAQVTVTYEAGEGA